MNKDILYRSSKDKPYFKIFFLSGPIIFIILLWQEVGFSNLSFEDILIFSMVMIILFFGIYASFEMESQIVVITKYSIIIYPNSLQKIRNFTIQRIDLKDFMGIEVNGPELNFKIKPRIVDKYQYQDEVTMSTSGWIKSRRLKKEIMEVINKYDKSPQ